MSEHWDVLLVTGSSRTSASLRVLFKSLFPEREIVQCEQIAAALDLLAGRHPWLALIDAALAEGADWRSAGEVGSPCLLLTHNQRQVEWAQAAGWQTLPLEGLTAARLAAALGEWLPG